MTDAHGHLQRFANPLTVSSWEFLDGKREEEEEIKGRSRRRGGSPAAAKAAA